MSNDLRAPHHHYCSSCHFSTPTFFFFLFFLHLQDDRSLINLHLMHTSYFLFVMVITMFCYAVIKGRPGKVRQSNVDYCPEKVQQPWRHTQQVKVARWPPAITAKAIPSVAGGAVRGLASRSPRAVSELWHGLMDEREEKKKNTSCLLNPGNTIRDMRALWMHYFRNVGFLQPKIYKCLFPVV